MSRKMKEIVCLVVFPYFHIYDIMHNEILQLSLAFIRAIVDCKDSLKNHCMISKNISRTKITFSCITQSY